CRIRRRGGVPAVANREIDAVRPQVAYEVVCRQADVQRRMRSLQAAESRQQPETRHADACGHRDRSRAVRLSDLADHVLQLLYGAVGAAKKPLALRGEAHAAVLSHEEPDAEMRLQRMDLAAHRGLGEAEIVGGEGDAHPSADGDEAFEQVQREEANERYGHGIRFGRAPRTAALSSN